MDVSTFWSFLNQKKNFVLRPNNIFFHVHYDKLLLHNKIYEKIIIFGRDMGQKLQKNAIQTRHQNFQLFCVFFLKMKYQTCFHFVAN